MASFSVFQRSRLVKFILFLVLLVILLQVFHMSLLTRLQAKEAFDKVKVPAGRRLKQKHLLDIFDTLEEKVRNSHRLDYSGTYHIISNILPNDNYNNYNDRQLEEDVAIVTQCSSNHLHHIVDMVDTWGGFISVTVFTFDKDLKNALLKIVQLYTCSEKIRKKISFHLVYPLNRAPSTFGGSWKGMVSCDKNISDERSVTNYAIEGIEYPHNLLRNLAIKYSPCRFVFMIDIDMIPSANLHSDFLKMWTSVRNARDNSTIVRNTAFIVPAFEVKHGVLVPSTKSDLLREWSRGRTRPFYKTVCWKCQKHTDYERWRGLEQTTGLQAAYRVDWKDPWEPFFIGSKIMPLYDERFKQYGFNRISQVCELHVYGFEFAVLNNAFLVHQGFKEKDAFHETKEDEMQRNVQLFRKFKEELKVKYPNSTRRCY